MSVQVDSDDANNIPLAEGSAVIDQSGNDVIVGSGGKDSVDGQNRSLGPRYQVSVIDKPMHRYAKGGNLSELLDLLQGGADIDEADDHGNTAAMLSARYGHTQILKMLIKHKADICHQNNEDEDLFKISVNSKEYDVLHVLVETLIEVGRARWNEDDPGLKSVKQAICEAASLGFCEKIQLLSKLNPNMEVCDDYGNTIFHYAAKTNMHEVITTFGHILDINVQNKQNGDTPLHVACRHENHEAIIALLDEKANVSLVNETGDNALHCFTRAVAKSVKKSERHTQVLEEYIDSWERRWFMEKSIPLSQNHKDYFRDRIQAIVALTRETENGVGESVLALAFRIGSVPVIEKFLSLDKVFCFHQKAYLQHDITQMTPRTLTSTKRTNKSRQSYIELLLENNPNETIAQVLNIEPLKNIEDMYSITTTFIYLIVILLHALYMSLFSYTSIVLMDRVREHPGNYTMDVQTILFYGVVPIEPLFFIISLVYRFHCSKTTWTNWKFLTPGTFVLQCFSIIHHVIYIILVAALMYQYYYRAMYNMHNTLSVTLLVGWLTTLSFTQGLKPIRFFWRMILHMIAVDVYKVLFVYVFVLLSFSFALHVQFQISTPVIQAYPTPFHTMFLVFRLMIGMSELFDGDFEKNIEKAGGSLALPIILFIVYIVLSTIVLLNLLIAMMNTSYSDILTNLKLSRRTETVQRAINLEKTVPWLTKLISDRVIRCGRVDYDNGRLVSADASPDGLVWFVVRPIKDKSSASSGKHQSNVAMEQMLTERMAALENNVIEQLGVLQNRLDDIHRELISQKK